MAVDEAVLETAIERGETTLRWYRWESPTVSLGYFQNSQSALAHPQIAGLPAVRRLTGGGAILHHHEWTYSIAIPASHPLADTPQRLYSGVHECVVEVLRELGVECRLRGVSHPDAEGQFLCFSRGDLRDIVCGDHKVAGSAQRRRHGAVLQHGSLLIARSSHVPEFPGMADLCPDAKWPSDLPARLAARVCPLLSQEGEFAGLSPVEFERVVELQRDRYSQVDWSSVRSSRAIVEGQSRVSGHADME